MESKVNVNGHSLVLDSSGNPHIAYHNATDHDLVHAWKCNHSWFSETVDSEGAVGGWPSLVLDRHGNVHIGYYDATNRNLKYARFDDGVWIIQTVDSERDKGWACSLALDGMGCPCISYGDRTSDSLKYAYIPPWWVYLPLIMRDCAR